jgi:hypothetical protein
MGYDGNLPLGVDNTWLSKDALNSKEKTSPFSQARRELVGIVSIPAASFWLPFIEGELKGLTKKNNSSRRSAEKKQIGSGVSRLIPLLQALFHLTIHTQFISTQAAKSLGEMQIHGAHQTFCFLAMDQTMGSRFGNPLVWPRECRCLVLAPEAANNFGSNPVAPTLRD